MRGKREAKVRQGEGGNAGTKEFSKMICFDRGDANGQEGGLVVVVHGEASSMLKN